MSKRIILMLIALVCANEIPALNIVRRAQWAAKAPIAKTPARRNLEYVIIHHSAGSYCTTPVTCQQQMRNLQAGHMNTLGWDDIGYNFGIGGDGNVYEGRGFGNVGAHATNWNSKSLGIMFMGNYNNYKPTAQQLQAAKELINRAVHLGYVRSNHIIKGHRQVGSTECPGDNLYDEITKWAKWRD